MTATINIYNIPQVVTLTLGGDTGASLMNYPVNRTDFKLMKGITNEILFFVKNVDRQPVTANSLANAGILDLRIVITDTENEILLLGEQNLANGVIDNSVLTPYTLVDPAKGVWKLSLAANDINDWPLGYLQYAIVGDRASDQVMLYTDRDYGYYSAIEVVQGPYPQPVEATTITPDQFINSGSSLVSGSYAGAASVGNISGSQSMVANIASFIGTIFIEASLENQPSQNTSDWFPANVTTVSHANAVIDQGVVSFNYMTDGPIYFQFTGNYLWVRFTVTTYSGTFNGLTYRNN